MPRKSSHQIVIKHWLHQEWVNRSLERVLEAAVVKIDLPVQKMLHFLILAGWVLSLPKQVKLLLTINYSNLQKVENKHDYIYFFVLSKLSSIRFGRHKNCYESGIEPTWLDFSRPAALWGILFGRKKHCTWEFRNLGLLDRFSAGHSLYLLGEE